MDGINEKIKYTIEMEQLGFEMTKLGPRMWKTAFPDDMSFIAKCSLILSAVKSIELADQYDNLCADHKKMFQIINKICADYLYCDLNDKEKENAMV